MTSLFVIILALAFLFSSLPATAEKKGKEGKKGPHPSERAYERASDNARFKRKEGGIDKTEKKNEEREYHREKRKHRGEDDQAERIQEEEALSDSEKEAKEAEKARKKAEKKANKSNRKEGK